MRLNAIRFRLIVGFILLLAFSLTPSSAADSAVETIKEVGSAAFSEVERRLIRDYYREIRGEIRDENRDRNYSDSRNHKQKDGKHKKHKKKSQGNVKGNPKGLPPGIAKKLARGGTMPPGIAKKNLPDDLHHRLPPVRDGYRRLETAGQIILVEVATDIIVDIIDRVFD